MYFATALRLLCREWTAERVPLRVLVGQKARRKTRICAASDGGGRSHCHFTFSGACTLTGHRRSAVARRSAGSGSGPRKLSSKLHEFHENGSNSIDWDGLRQYDSNWQTRELFATAPRTREVDARGRVASTHALAEGAAARQGCAIKIDLKSMSVENRK